MVNKPKLNEPDVETTFTATGESLTINMTIPTKQFKDIFVTGTSVINQQYNFTLDECIKKWVDKGFIVNSNDLYIFLHHEQQGISMFIHKQDIKYHIYYGYISLELNELLTQTLKALENIKNE